MDQPVEGRAACSDDFCCSLFIELDLRLDPVAFKTEPLDHNFSPYEFFIALIDTSEEVMARIGNAVHRLENPELSNRNTTDCLSCHSATTVRIHPISTMPIFSASLSARNPDRITGFPEPGTLQNHDLNWNLRALGYFDQRPTVSMRTVHEAAASADRINKALGLKNPGPNCAARYAEVMSCFVKASTQAGLHSTTDECLSLCQAR